jgi:NodT family efflux transporter outer membrane factor (OMF) lipoprotein
MAAQRKFATFLPALMLLVAGCMVGPDYHRPPAEISHQWIESGQPGVSQSREQNQDWWRVFNDRTLNRLVIEAYRQNLTLREAGARVLEARAQLGEAIGNLYPQQQTLGAGVDYDRLPIALPYQLINNEFWRDSFMIQSGWELDIWGKIRRSIESASDSYLASIASYDSVLVTLIADVASTYVQIRTTQKQLTIAHDNVKTQEGILKIAVARFEGGVVTERDVDQAKNVLDTTEAAVPMLEIQLRQSLNSLAVLLGRAPGAIDGQIAGSYGQIPTAPADVAVGIPADLLLRRPDLHQAELEAAAQCSQIGFAKADLFPTFEVVGTLGTVSTDIANGGLGGVFSKQTLFWSTGPTVSWNVLNYGQITNNVRLQDAKYQELLFNFTNDVLNAQGEVENGLTTFLESRREAAFLTRATAAANDALVIADIQYREGTVDFTTVLTAEQTLFQTENSRAVADGTIPLGLIATYRALGGGWQIRQGHDFLPAHTRKEMSQRTNWGSLLKPKGPGLPSLKDNGPLVRPPEF